MVQMLRKQFKSFHVLLSSLWFTKISCPAPISFLPTGSCSACSSSCRLLRKPASYTTCTPPLLSERSFSSQEFCLCLGRGVGGPSCLLSPSAARPSPRQGIGWILAMQRFWLSSSRTCKLCVHYRFWPETCLVSSGTHGLQALFLNERFL